MLGNYGTETSSKIVIIYYTLSKYTTSSGEDQFTNFSAKLADVTGRLSTNCWLLRDTAAAAAAALCWRTQQHCSLTALWTSGKWFRTYVKFSWISTLSFFFCCFYISFCCYAVKSQVRLVKMNNNSCPQKMDKLLKITEGQTICHQLAVPRVCRSTLGMCVFSVAWPTIWNSLPDHLWDLAVDFEQFRRDLKTYLFAGHS